MKNSFPDPVEFLSAIHKAGVRYLLIGRQAVIAYGGPMQTMDFDIMVDGSEENVGKLLIIAEKRGLAPSVEEKNIKRVFKFKLENDITVDVFRARSYTNKEGETLTFEDLYRRKVVMQDPKGLAINLPDIGDLIALKKIRWEAKDREDIRYLERIRERIKR
jgi:hypothetical protein